MVSIEPLGQLVPGPASASVDCLKANNNLDLIFHCGRWYLVWRTAPSHFASERARLEIASTADLGGTWRHDKTIALGCDLREPRFVSEGDTLRLFFMELGTDPKRFQPRQVHRIDYEGGSFGDPEVVLDEPVVPWRIKRLKGQWTMITYRGAESIYGPFPADPVVEVRVSDDLHTWGPPIVIHRGGTECELVELLDGSFVGVTRNEGPRRFGGDLLTGSELSHLDVTPLAPKFDSPFLFLWDGEPWLVARRSLAFGGRYDLAPGFLPGMVRIRVNQLAWWLTRKRSALWRVDAERRAVSWEGDLPTRGDTSFAAVVPGDDGSFIVADYTSPESAGDPPWVRGQVGPTVIQLLRVRKDRNPVGQVHPGSFGMRGCSSELGAGAGGGDGGGAGGA